MDRKAEDIVRRFEKMAKSGALGGVANFRTEFDCCADLRDGAVSRLKRMGFSAWVDDNEDLRFSWSGEPQRLPWWRRIFGAK